LVNGVCSSPLLITFDLEDAPEFTLSCASNTLAGATAVLGTNAPAESAGFQNGIYRWIPPDSAMVLREPGAASGPDQNYVTITIITTTASMTISSLTFRTGHNSNSPGTVTPIDLEINAATLSDLSDAMTVGTELGIPGNDSPDITNNFSPAITVPQNSQLIFQIRVTTAIPDIRTFVAHYRFKVEGLTVNY